MYVNSLIKLTNYEKKIIFSIFLRNCKSIYNILLSFRYIFKIFFSEISEVGARTKIIETFQNNITI